MRRSVMRQLLPLAVVCLLAVQVAASARGGSGRLLKAAPRGDPILPTRIQFVQATWALKGVDCQAVTAKLVGPNPENPNQNVPNLLRAAMVQDFQNALRTGWPEAVSTVRGTVSGQPCLDSTVGGEKYASYRAMVRFNGTTDTDVRDLMWSGVTTVGNLCTGGYSRSLYSSVAKLWTGFTVSQNNGNRQNPFFNGTQKWIPYAGPDMCPCNPANCPRPSPSPTPSPSPSPSPSASPSPSPAASPSPSPAISPSPSPAVSPSPSPSPSPAPLNCSSIPGSVSNGTACICTGTNPIPALSNNTLVACVASCTGNYPVSVRSGAVITGTLVACTTATLPCPIISPFPYFAAAAAGQPATLVQCTPTPPNFAITGCNIAQNQAFIKPVQDNDVTTIGCLDASATTTVCPTGLGYGLPYLTSTLTLASCRVSTQTTCTTGMTMAVNSTNNKLDACLASVLSQNCPQQWPVFAQASISAAPTICISGPITTCPTSQTPSLSFPFQLVSGTTIQGCLGTQGAISSCAGYSPWNGGIIVDQSGVTLGCSRSLTTCPAGMLAFWQRNAGAAPTLLQCRPPLGFGQTCVNTAPISGVLFSTNLRDINNTIIGCYTGGQACPDSAGVLQLPAWVASSFAARNSPTDCLPSTASACPQPGGAQVALYRGIQPGAPRSQTALALPVLQGCVTRQTGATNCDAYADVPNNERWSAEVYGDAAGTILAGCATNADDVNAAANAVPGGANALTPCPAGSQFVFQSTTPVTTTAASAAPAADAAGGDASLVECRPARNDCINPLNSAANVVSTYTVRMVAVDGTLIGCKEAPANAGSTSTRACSPGTAGDTRKGFPYDFNFPLIGGSAASANTPEIVECRKTLSTPPTAANAATFCASGTYAGASTFSKPLLTGINIAAPADVVGCLSSSNVRCPTVADIRALSCTYGQGSRAASTVCGAPSATAAAQVAALTGFPIPMFNAAGAIDQCRWNGVGGGDVNAATGAANTDDTVPLQILTDQIAVVCGGAYQTLVSQAATVGAGVSGNTIAGLTQTAPTGTVAAANSGVNVKGCVATFSPASVCLAMAGTGFPFPAGAVGTGTMAGASQRFILELPDNQPLSGILRACMHLGTASAGANICTAAASGFRVSARSSATAIPFNNFLAGCTGSGTAAAATQIQVDTCTAWLSGYSAFTSNPPPPVTCTSLA